MLKKYIALPVLFSLLSGCAINQMKENEYAAMSHFLAANRKCFDDGFLTPTAYSQSNDAAGYALSGMRFDRERLTSMTRSASANFSTDQKSCRYVESAGVSAVANAANDRRADERNSDAIAQYLRSQNNAAAANRPVNCMRMGNMTSCN